MARSAAVSGGAFGLALLAAGAIEAQAETIELPTFDVVATTPLGGGEIDVSKVPGAVWQTGAQDIQTFNDTTITRDVGAPGARGHSRQCLGQRLSARRQLSRLRRDVGHRNADGLAVYQNGVRINEAFGDTVNWDLIPANAIDKMTIVAGNPIFGLNALGGALNVTMKNGFTWQGVEADLRGGSFYRAQEELQFGKQIGDWSVYMAATQINDGGWRVDGASQLTNFYGDLGYRAGGFESHLQLTVGNTQFGAAAYTPIQELQNNWSSIYTVPQTTNNQMGMLAWTGDYAYSNTLSFQGGLYFRSFNQQHVDGNSTERDALSAIFVSERKSCPRHSRRDIPDISQNGAVDLGEIDRFWTQSRSLGGSVQAVDTDKIYGHENTLTVGASLDYGWTNFTGNSQLGTSRGS